MEIKYIDNNRVYVLNKPKEYMQKIPTRKHRFKNGSGSCSLTVDEYYDLIHNKTHILYMDMTLGKAFLFGKEDVLPTITKKSYMGSFIYVAELMPLYVQNKYLLVGAK